MNTKRNLIQFCLLAVLLALPMAVQAQVNYAISGSTAYVASSPNANGYIVIDSTYQGYPVTSIGDDAFDSCTGMIGVSIPNSVTSIGIFAFLNCTSLTSVIIGTNVTSIGDDAFNGTGLGIVTIPNSVTSIGDDAFSDCFSLAIVTIPNSVTNIGQHAFDSCSSLTIMTIPNSVTSIGQFTFNGTSLTSVAIPNSVTSIGNRAFQACFSLTNVIIPNSVTNIAAAAFQFCPALAGVYFRGNAPTPTTNTTVFSGDTNAIAYYLPGATNWGATFDGIPAVMRPPPALAISTYSNQPVLFFPAGVGAGYVVQMTTNLSTGPWVTVTNGAVMTAIMVTNPPVSAFFRLQ
jgi:hypothetical protein